MNHTTLIFLFCLWLLLFIATGLVKFIIKSSNTIANDTLYAKMQDWLWMLALITVAVFSHHLLLNFILAIISYFLLKEFLSLTPPLFEDKRILLWSYGVIPLQYFWADILWYGMFIAFIPLYVFILVPFGLLLMKQTNGIIKSAVLLQWRLLIAVFSISHVAFILRLPNKFVGLMSGAGLLLFLFFLTQINDLAQQAFDHIEGERKIIPEISPQKTWEGMIGGVIITMFFALLINPLLTVFSWQIALILGFLIGISGFISSFTITAIERELGVDQPGDLLSKHDVIRNTLNSFTFTAPVFLNFIYYFYY